MADREKALAALERLCEQRLIACTCMETAQDGTRCPFHAAERVVRFYLSDEARGEALQPTPDGERELERIVDELIEIARMAGRADAVMGGSVVRDRELAHSREGALALLREAQQPDDLSFRIQPKLRPISAQPDARGREEGE